MWRENTVSRSTRFMPGRRSTAAWTPRKHRKPSICRRSSSRTERLPFRLRSVPPAERPHRQVEEKQKRIAFLEKKVQTKDEVLAELMSEHIALRKSLGEL